MLAGRHWPRVVFVLALLWAPLAVALELRLDPTGLDATQQAQARALVAQVQARLPATWQADPRRLPLRFDPALPAGVVGHHRAGQLWLAPSVLGQPPDAAGRDPAQAALIHEIAHALDRDGGRWSSERAFRRLAGWDRLGPGNAYTLRSPDRYEHHSPAESFAVNLEWFLLDPRYACRRPLLARWFSERFGPPPAQPACAAAQPWLAASVGQGQMQVEWIDPARVYAVDYLLADSGGPPMSRFGHSMLRLVICAEGRPLGERCRMDLSEHRVLSFRAFVDDVQVSSWRGLTGGYPSRLFLLPLTSVIDEYNRVELRDLRAWPLALDRQQIADLLASAAGLHWRYDGAYSFIGNNCAVETGRLLDTAFDPAGGSHYRNTFPKGVLRQLLADGLAAPQAFDDPAAATAQGRLFVSARQEYRLLLARLHAAGQVPALPLERWLDAPARMRGAIPAEPTLEQAAAWLVLEQAALRRRQLRALQALRPQLANTPALAGAVAGWLGWLQRLDAPGRLPVDGYGLPQAQELAQAPLAELLAQGPAHWQQLQQQAEAALPAAQREQLQHGRQRVAQLSHQVRVLAAAGAR